MTGPGTVTVPFDQLNFATGASLGNFNEIHFLFETASESLSFSLDEIRIVPEPCVASLLAISVSFLALRKRTTECRTSRDS